MKRAVVAIGVALAALVGANGASALPSTPLGGGFVQFHTFFYATSYINHWRFNGYFPTGNETFNGKVWQSGSGGVFTGRTPTGGTFSTFTIAGASSDGAHFLTGFCSGQTVDHVPGLVDLYSTPSTKNPRIGAVLTCITKVDGVPKGKSRIIVMATGTPAPTYEHGSGAWDFSGRFVR
jgi:hypothetical protein